MTEKPIEEGRPCKQQKAIDEIMRTPSLSETTKTCVEATFNTLADYEISGLTPEEIVALNFEVAGIRESVKRLYDDQRLIKRLEEKGVLDTDIMVNRALELLEADDNGLLLRLPCRVGDPVYHIFSLGEESVVERGFKLEDLPLMNNFVFLTREEAVEADESLKRSLSGAAFMTDDFLEE